ncbi:VapE domain-containing protein [Azotobacter salinestris]|uniref:VapE domain-containing protein n=1 Tax=Azotobacter salinestris TaxID=69964 RepID=UPI0032DE6ECA
MNAPANQFAQYIEPVARLLLGKPNVDQSKPDNLRFGSRGSLSVDLKQGVWHDHESNQGGGVLDLIARETSKTGRAAVEWLERQGIHRPANENAQAPEPRKRGKLVATYDYVSEAGELLFQVCRMEPKDFRQRKPVDSGWSWSVKGVRQVPYRLPQMLEQPDTLTFIVEGEKDADTLAAAGLVATCNAGGANKWPNALAPYFKGRQVVILPDNDDAGRSHAAMVASKLAGVAASVRVLELPDLPHKGDVSDWLAAGRDAAELLAMAGALPVPANDNLPEQFDQVRDVHDLPPVTLMTWPHTSSNGQPLNTIPNLAHLLNHYGFVVRYDVIRKDLRITYPGQCGTPDNQRSKAFDTVLSLAALNRLPKSDTQSFLLSIGDDSAVNPVMDFILSRPWDGRSRLAELLDTIKTRPGFDRDLLAVLVRRWLVSAVAAAAKPFGFWSKGVLVFQGEQSLGKTAWIRSLLPEDLRDLVKIDATINPDNKDSIISAVSHWLVELGELDGTLRKADIARLKGFISQDVDQFRRPYGRVEEKFQRRTVFFASVNPEQFLADDTGNVRWWTVPVVGVNYSHGIDTQQLWAEVFNWFQAGERWWLDRDEEARLEAVNAEHQQTDPVQELIQSRYGAAPVSAITRRMTATDVLLEMGFDRPTQRQKNDAGQTLRKLFGAPKRTKAGLLFDVPVTTTSRPY